MNFGKNCIVIAIDGKKNSDGKFTVRISGGKEDTGIDLIEWAKKCEELGAGEILLTSMDSDGTKKGYDIEMTKAVTDNVTIPVVVSGGCGSIKDIVEVFEKTNCVAALVASMLHYKETTIGQIREELRKNKIY